MNTRRLVGGIALGVTVLFALSPLYRNEPEVSVRLHHLLHFALLVGAAIAGMSLASLRPSRGGELWLLLSVISPMVAMLLMWPTEYSPLEHLPASHAAEHVALVACGFLTGYAGRAFAPGVGLAMSLTLWGMALLSVWGYGSSPPSQVDALGHLR